MGTGRQGPAHQPACAGVSRAVALATGAVLSSAMDHAPATARSDRAQRSGRGRRRSGPRRVTNYTHTRCSSPPRRRATSSRSSTRSQPWRLEERPVAPEAAGLLTLLLVATPDVLTPGRPVPPTKGADVRFSVWPDPPDRSRTWRASSRPASGSTGMRRTSRTTSCRTGPTPRRCAATRPRRWPTSPRSPPARRGSASGRSSPRRRTGTPPSSRRPSRDRPDQRWPRDLRDGRGLAGERARELRHRARARSPSGSTGSTSTSPSSTRCSRSRRRPSTATTSASTTRRTTPVRCRPDLPILLGVRGRRRTMAIAARHASVWNAWTTPEDLAECNAVLDGHCEAIGRDPADDRALHPGAAVHEHRRVLARAAPRVGRDAPRSSARPAEVAEIVGRYERAGCDELIVPCFTLGRHRAGLETLELFSEEVARHFPG